MKLFSSALNLFYPNYCLHCFGRVKNKYFCENCISYFTLISPQKDQFYFAVFEKTAPIRSFIKEIKRNKIYGLIKLAASFIVVQHCRLNWEIPDVVIPITKNKIFKDHLYYISKEVALLLGSKVKYKHSCKQSSLFLDDIFDRENIRKISNENRSKKIYYLCLCDK